LTHHITNGHVAHHFFFQVCFWINFSYEIKI
jgi:hypothetical protein